ncbi:MAG: hypothetical protein ABI633_13785 [Burkholderiales bacterium]
MQRVEHQDGLAILKRERPAHGAWRYALMRAAARLTGVQTLLPVPAHGGARAQAIELRRLRELRAAGVPVPTVLRESADGIVLQFVGDRALVEQFKLDAATGLTAWRRGLDAIADVHARGQYLSQAFARNMLEHDPLETMSLVQAQTRDWLAYLHSSIWLLTAPRTALLEAWDTTARAMLEPVAQCLRSETHRLLWLRYLPARRRPWGRDVVSLQALAAFLHAWASETKSTKGA